MKIKLINFGYETAPKRAHYNDAGADVYLPCDVEVHPWTTVRIPLGFGVEIPDGFAGYIIIRSGLASKGLDCKIPPIDSGYRGEISAIVSNSSSGVMKFKKGERIGQLVIMPCVLADFVEELPNERGTGAYGSTGA